MKNKRSKKSRSKQRNIYFSIWASLPIILYIIDFLSGRSNGIKDLFLQILYFLMIGAILYIPIGIILNIIYNIKSKFKPVKQHKDTRKIRYYTNIDNFMNDLESKKSKANVNEINVMEDDNQQGAFITLNKLQLHENKENISNGFIKRSSEERVNSNVPHFNLIDNTPVRKDSGKKEYPYHRTHLLPFRFCLSDGDIPRIMFTGTNHLNTGNRIYENYYYEESTYDYRFNHTSGEMKYTDGKFLSRLETIKRAVGDTMRDGWGGTNLSAFNIEEKYGKFLGYKKELSISKDDISYNGIRTTGIVEQFIGSTEKILDAFEFEKKCHISLYDIENYVSSEILKANDHTVFTYGVVCNYKETYGFVEKIPESVTIYFYNKSKNKLLLGVTLDNVN